MKSHMKTTPSTHRNVVKHLAQSHWNVKTLMEMDGMADISKLKAGSTVTNLPAEKKKKSK